MKSPKNENKNSRSENISHRCLLVGLKNHAAKNIDFLNKNQCQKSAVINVSIIYFSHSTKGYLLQLKKTFPLRVSIQGVKSLGCHFACLCQGFEFNEVKKNVIIFKKKMEILLHFLKIF